MLEKIKKSVAVVLAATFIMLMFAIAPGAAEQNEKDVVCVLSGVEVTDNIATVKYGAKENFTSLAAIYDENTGAMIASGKASAFADEETVGVTLETESMPEHFIVKAFALDEHNAPLTEKCCSEMYTTKYQESEKPTINYSEPEGDINVDGGDVTDFDVFSYDISTNNSLPPQNVTVGANISSITAEYSNKVEGADYIVAVVKDEKAENVLSADNLMYIDQFTSDNDGKISAQMPVSADISDYDVVIFGPEKNRLKGDVNGDGKVNIDDVTLIQKYIANIAELDSIQLKAADVNDDENANIDDVTMIQKVLAGMAVLE